MAISSTDDCFRDGAVAQAAATLHHEWVRWGYR